MARTVVKRSGYAERLLFNQLSGTTISDARGWHQTSWTRSDIQRQSPDRYGYRMPTAYTSQEDNRGWLGFHTGYRHERGVTWLFPTQVARGTGWVVPGLPDLSQPNANQLWMQIRNKVADEVVDVAMAVAELQSTADTLTGLLNRVGRSMLNFRKRNPYAYDFMWNGRLPRDRSGRVLRGRRADRFLRTTAGAYLEWKYGIMPTVYDVAGLCAGLDMTSNGKFFRNAPLLTAKSGIVEKVEDNVALTSSNFGGEGAVSVSGAHGIVGRCDYMVKGEGLHGLNRFGLGLTTLATIAYDKTPFSFVFNMVVPMAEIIKAWGALTNVEVVSYSETRFTNLTFAKGSLSRIRNGDFVEAITIDYGGGSYRHMNRVVRDHVPLPMPFLRNPVKTGNLATVLSLFTSLRPRAKG